MKIRVIAISFVFSSLIFLANAVANAQAQTVTFKAVVPFPFVVGSQTLPAGTYQVQRLLGRPLEADQVGMIVIRSTDSRLYKTVVTDLVYQSLGSRSGSQLVFARRGGQHYLSEVHVHGEKEHRIPNLPRQLEFAGSAVSQEEIVVAELR